MLIQSTKNASNNRLKFLIYGRPGVGKTSLTKTIGEPTLIVSAEAGHLVLSDADIDMIDMSTNDKGDLLDKAQRFARLLDIYKYIQTDVPRKKYKWLVLDSLTEIADNLVDNLDTQERFQNPKMVLLKWAEYTRQMESLIKAFRDIPYFNVIFTAISDESKDEAGTKDKTKVLLKGQKFPEKVGMYFDEYFYMGIQSQKEEDKRYLLTQATSNIEAKDRSGKLSKYEEPNIAKIAAKIRGLK